MLIPYLVKRGRFLPKFAAYIGEYKQSIDHGQTVKINLAKAGGYSAKDLRIEILQDDPNFFVPFGNSTTGQDSLHG